MELRPTEIEIQRHRVQRWFAVDDQKTHTEEEWTEHEAVGYLVLTNERLIFEPTRFEQALRRKMFAIPLRVLNVAAIFRTRDMTEVGFVSSSRHSIGSANSLSSRLLNVMTKRKRA